MNKKASELTTLLLEVERDTTRGWGAGTGVRSDVMAGMADEVVAVHKVSPCASGMRSSSDHCVSVLVCQLPARTPTGLAVLSCATGERVHPQPLVHSLDMIAALLVGSRCATRPWVSTCLAILNPRLVRLCSNESGPGFGADLEP